MSTFRSFATGCSCRKNKDILLLLPDFGSPGLPYEGVFSLLHIKKTYQGYLMEYNPKSHFPALLEDIVRFIKKLRVRPNIVINVVTHGLSHLFVPLILKETVVDKLVLMNPYWSDHLASIESIPSYIKQTLETYQRAKYSHPQLRKELLRFDVGSLNAIFKECERMTPSPIPIETPTLILLSKSHEPQLDNIIRVYKKCRVESVQSDEHVFFLSTAFRQFMNNILSGFL